MIHKYFNQSSVKSEAIYSNCENYRYTLTREWDAEKQKVVLVAESKRKAEALRGDGDAQAIKIYSDSFGQDEKFFKFYRSMLAYENTFSDDGTTMLLSPDSDFFSFFGNQSGN